MVHCWDLSWTLSHWLLPLPSWPVWQCRVQLWPRRASFWWCRPLASRSWSRKAPPRTSPIGRLNSQNCWTSWHQSTGLSGGASLWSEDGAGHLQEEAAAAEGGKKKVWIYMHLFTYLVNTDLVENFWLGRKKKLSNKLWFSYSAVVGKLRLTKICNSESIWTHEFQDIFLTLGHLKIDLIIFSIFL